MDLRAWLAAEDPAPLVIATSGSTGAPKRVVLRREAVVASARASAQRLGATGPWVQRLPEGYVAGVQVAVRSLLAGRAPLTDWPEPDTGPWFTSLVPTQLHRVLTAAPDDRAAAVDRAALARAHTVLLGGGPIDPALRARAEAEGIRVVATYGAAETAGGCVYDGVPLAGVEVRLGERGRIELRGPVLAEGYEDDPGLTAAHFVDGWFLTSDAGELTTTAEGGVTLRVLGRLDDVVVSGGLNVPGPAVAARLRAHPGVAAAEVLGAPDEEWGQRLVAFVVPVDSPPSSTELRDWVAAVHPRAWAPRQVVVLPDLPLLANGKPDRRALLAAVGAEDPRG
ncbi:AMP-binding protein [Nocardioides sp.]|uniref:AMP-binding protein n=1 Tax=Nocardioides sp. TaxID=35761 RepID=UPI0035136AA7